MNRQAQTLPIRWAVVAGAAGAFFGAAPGYFYLHYGLYVGLVVGIAGGIILGILEASRAGWKEAALTFLGVSVGITLFVPLALAFRIYIRSLAEGAWMALVAGGLAAMVGLLAGAAVGLYLRRQAQPVTI